jgi:tyrosine-protein kinase Etk/Wzc
MRANSNQTEPVDLPDDEVDSDFSLLDLITVLAENARLVIGIPLLSGMLVLGMSFLMTPGFTATAQILSPQQQNTASALLGSLGGLSGLAGGAIGLKNPADQWVGLLKSQTIADAMVTRFKLRERYKLEYNFEARKVLSDLSRFAAGKDGLITIEVDDGDPQTAADMANAYIDELSKLSDHLAVSEAGQRRTFFEQQLRTAKERLIAAEIALKESGINTSIIKTSPEAAVTALSQLQAQITAADIRLQVLRTRLTENSSDYQDAQRELTTLKRQLTQAEQKNSTAGHSQGTEYVTRFREFKYYETLYEMMARQYEIARADEAREGAVIQIVDKATVPEWKSRPKRALLAISATLLAAFMTILYVFGREIIRNMQTDPLQAEKLQRLRRSWTFGGH